MPIQDLLLNYYGIGKAREGEWAYPPLLLFECLLLQKWFQIKSDPELESQINDRLSFKSFLKLPMDCPAPDHCTFSRFRKRLSKEAMTHINTILLHQFHAHGLTINAGMAVDARLVKSASRPLAKDQLEKLKKESQNPDSKIDKGRSTKRFSRDLDSDWTIKNYKAHYGLKEHAAVDTQHGFILSTILSPASHYDSTYLPMTVCPGIHTADKIKAIYADKGYAGEPNRKFLALNNIEYGIMRKDSRNTIDLMFRQFAFNLKKGLKILRLVPV
jgi:IS5 family transposase